MAQMRGGGGYLPRSIHGMVQRQRRGLRHGLRGRVVQLPRPLDGNAPPTRAGGELLFQNEQLSRSIGGAHREPSGVHPAGESQECDFGQVEERSVEGFEREPDNLRAWDSRSGGIRAESRDVRLVRRVDQLSHRGGCPGSQQRSGHRTQQRETGQTVAGRRPHHRQRHPLVPHRHLALHPSLGQHSAPQIRLRPWIRQRQRRQENVQIGWERGGSPRYVGSIRRRFLPMVSVQRGAVWGRVEFFGGEHEGYAQRRFVRYVGQFGASRYESVWEVLRGGGSGCGGSGSRGRRGGFGFRCGEKGICREDGGFGFGRRSKCGDAGV
mmetsp:Transcript_7079/g.15504  ORF Transcript_7079/g.15504 Transcript_7079/m.15504 type:complete len:323 (-) Transcript_7079:1052-2020(-)